MAQDLMNGPLSDAIHLRDDFTLSLSQRRSTGLGLASCKNIKFDFFPP